MDRWCIPHAAYSREDGFTLIEFVVVIVIAMVLMDVAAGGIVPARQAAALESADYAFRSLHARARAHAIERGTNARVELDPAEDRARVIVESDTLISLDFAETYGVDVESRVSGSMVELIQCMTPRGVGDGPCTSFYSPAEISFIQDGRTRALRLLPLGQVLDG